MSQNDIQGLQSSGESHKLSIGLILVLYGLFGNADYSRSDHININLWWGLLMLVFGIIMALGGYIAARRRPAHLPPDAHDAMVKP